MQRRAMGVAGWTLLLAAVLASARGRTARAEVTPATTPPVLARDISSAFAAAARAIGPAVVRIEVPGAVQRNGAGHEEGDTDVGGGGDPPLLLQAGTAGTASGIVIDTRGNVLTAAHVVADARRIRVIFADGSEHTARVIGKDQQTDVALIRIDRPPRGLTAARLGDSRAVEVGDWVLTVGSPLGMDQTVTVGIVSALARNPQPGPVVAHRVRRYIETDAKINPGSSGGPLVSLSGEVIGMSTLINAGPGGAYGFAVPVNEARRVAQALIAEGRVRYAYLGVALRDMGDLDPGERPSRNDDGGGGSGAGGAPPLRGAVVSRILDGAPAARAGIEPGDVIVSIDNRDMVAADDVVDYVADRTVGTQVVVGFVRRGSARVARLRLDELPDSLLP